MTTSVAARDAQNSGKSILQDRVIVVQLSYRRPADGREGENDLLQAVTGRGRAGIGAELVNSGWLARAKHGGGGHDGENTRLPTGARTRAHERPVRVGRIREADGPWCDGAIFRSGWGAFAGGDGLRRILVELVGGIVLLVGFKTQWVAGLLAIWSLITGFAVHLVAGVSDADAMVAYDNMIHFYKNLAIAGGFLFVLVYGAGRLSIDGAFIGAGMKMPFLAK